MRELCMRVLMMFGTATTLRSPAVRLTTLRAAVDALVTSLAAAKGKLGRPAFSALDPFVFPLLFFRGVRMVMMPLRTCLAPTRRQHTHDTALLTQLRFSEIHGADN